MVAVLPLPGSNEWVVIPPQWDEEEKRPPILLGRRAVVFAP